MNKGIFIISHKRPQCVTWHTLKKVGYQGPCYIIVDDMDGTDYESVYGDNVIRFRKQDYIDKIDTCDNFREVTTPVYARNACFDIARSKGYDCFGMLDDDIKSIGYRYIRYKRLKSRKIVNFTEIFKAYCEYIINSNLACCGFVTGGRLIGGVKNPLSLKCFYFNPTNAYIINMHIKQYPFIGTLWEDSIYCYCNNMTGKIVAAAMPIVVGMEKPGSMKAGGNKELYERNLSYVAECYGNMVIPSFVRWEKGFSKHIFSQDVPKILNEKWRKSDER